MVSSQMPAAAFRHDLFVYDTDDSFVAQLARYVVAGLDADEQVLVVVGAHKRAMLAEMLGEDAEDVTFTDTAEVYTRPAHALARYDVFVRNATEPSSPGVRVYGELPPCRTQAEWNGWTAYEAIANRVFDGRRLTAMCGYDARTVPESVVQQAWKTHQVVLDGAWQVSPDYEDPEVFVRSLTPAFEEIPGLRELVADGLPRMQVRVAEAIASLDMAEPRARDLLVAVREVLANASVHGRGVRSLRVGTVDGVAVVEVKDGGPGLDDPLAGFVPPREPAGESAGLWIARQLTSRLELHSRPDGLTVRLWG
jgi:anti-sigma regulatory factor (Ser/Thr protein kinase)